MKNTLSVGRSNQLCLTGTTETAAADADAGGLIGRGPASRGACRITAIAAPETAGLTYEKTFTLDSEYKLTVAPLPTLALLVSGLTTAPLLLGA